MPESAVQRDYPIGQVAWLRLLDAANEAGTTPQRLAVVCLAVVSQSLVIAALPLAKSLPKMHLKVYLPTLVLERVDAMAKTFEASKSDVVEACLAASDLGLAALSARLIGERELVLQHLQQGSAQLDAARSMFHRDLLMASLQLSFSRPSEPSPER